MILKNSTNLGKKKFIKVNTHKKPSNHDQQDPSFSVYEINLITNSEIIKNRFSVPPLERLFHYISKETDNRIKVGQTSEENWYVPVSHEKIVEEKNKVLVEYVERHCLYQYLGCFFNDERFSKNESAKKIKQQIESKMDQWLQTYTLNIRNENSHGAYLNQTRVDIRVMHAIAQEITQYLEGLEEEDRTFFRTGFLKSTDILVLILKNLQEKIILACDEATARNMVRCRYGDFGPVSLTRVSLFWNKYILDHKTVCCAAEDKYELKNSIDNFKKFADIETSYARPQVEHFSVPNVSKIALPRINSISEELKYSLSFAFDQPSQEQDSRWYETLSQVEKDKLENSKGYSDKSWRLHLI